MFTAPLDIHPQGFSTHLACTWCWFSFPVLLALHSCSTSTSGLNTRWEPFGHRLCSSFSCTAKSDLCLP